MAHGSWLMAHGWPVGVKGEVKRHYRVRYHQIRRRDTS
jgi:hypothetical protein